MLFPHLQCKGVKVSDLGCLFTLEELILIEQLLCDGMMHIAFKELIIPQKVMAYLNIIIFTLYVRK